MKNVLKLLLITLFFAVQGCDDKNNGEDNGIPARLPGNIVSAIYVTADGIRYFATDKGLASFDGTDWTVYDENPKVTTKSINDMDFEQSVNGSDLWLGTNEGVTVATLPLAGTTNATTYTKANTQQNSQPGLAGDSVSVAMVDGDNLRWFGTHEGLSVFRGNQWPQINYNGHYFTNYFRQNRITSMAYSNDTIYIGTKGGGVARMIGSQTDAITGASPYEIPWSFIPSENILSVFIDGNSQWYGSDDGLVRHDGIEAKENWNLFYKEDGLVDNYVQVINKDNSGNLWFGTRGGVSRFNGTTWTNYTTADGLVGNNVLCITIDRDGTIWFGTDNGASHFNGSGFTNYQAAE